MWLRYGIDGTPSEIREHKEHEVWGMCIDGQQILALT